MDWKLGPPVLVGEEVIWCGNKNNSREKGTVRWIGKIPDLSSGWFVGIELDNPLPEGSSDGFCLGRKLFECRPKHGTLVPINEIQKPSRSNTRHTIIESHSDVKLDGSQVRNFTHSELGGKSLNKSQEVLRKHRYSALESKLTDWSLKKRTSDRLKNVPGLDFKNKSQKKFEDVLESLNARQQQLLKFKNQDGKSSLKKKRKKRKSYETLSKTHGHDHSTLKNFEDRKSTCEKSQISEPKVTSRDIKNNMNDVAGYFKELKEDDDKYREPETEKSVDDISGFSIPDSGHGKEKKFFSFLKWFKKNKDDSNFKFKESSAASSPISVRRRTSSCESVDTLFSTQTVRSFAYIPPYQYEPSAPPLDFDKSSYENVFENAIEQKNTVDDSESIYDRRKKRKAPEPPRLTRENSLPTTLEHKTDELTEDAKTFHRRTVSESFKDKKAGAYCHVQGKRKAPPPPPVSTLYPNLQKLKDQPSTLHKKKKPAPPPPNAKNETGQNFERDVDNQKKDEKSTEKERKNMKSTPEGENRKEKSNQSPTKLVKDVSLSPLPSRPWYKRSHRDSNGSNIIKKDLLKGFEKKKQKDSEDWMPEVGFPRRNFSTDSNYNKFNIFTRLDKSEDKKKEEKRKSQISILTNISELDREAAEIVRKEQAEEKKMLEANDDRYYSSHFSGDNFKKAKNPEIGKQNKEPRDKPEDYNVSNNLNNKNKKDVTVNSKKPSDRDVRPTTASHLPSTQNFGDKIPNDGKITSKNDIRKDQKEKVKVKECVTDTNNVKESPNPLPQQNLTDKINASASSTKQVKEDEKNFSTSKNNDLNYFKVENKEVNYLNEPWVCQKCTLENPGWRVFCEICSSVKPRFLYNPVQKAQIKLTKDIDLKPEIKKPEPKNVKQENPKPTKPTTPPKEDKPILNIENLSSKEGNENKKDEPEESLEDLRKKRMNFFATRQNSSTQNESGAPENEMSKDQMKQILKEMKNSFPKNNQQDKSKNETSKETTTTEETEKQEISANTGNVSSGTSPEKIKTLNIEETEKKQPAQPKKEQIAEAYIITKTIVLEDIIVKKKDKTTKVTSSAQTNTNSPTEPEPGPSGVKPPPRTKKLALEMATVNVDKKKEKEPLDLSPAENATNKFTQEDLEELTNKLTHAEGLADFRATIETMPLNTEMNTVAVNRLLRKLETAINCGDQYLAAALAKELALMKINCSVTRQAANQPAANSKITIDLYVEDKLSHQGPIPIQVSPSMTLLQLKKKVHQELGIPVEVQRWILGKRLETDDCKTLESDGIKTDSCSVFLYLVAPDKRQSEKDTVGKPNEKKAEDKTPPKDNFSAPKGKGWYYNYEEDHYSYCEDSEEEPPEQTPEPTNKPKANSPQPGVSILNTSSKNNTQTNIPEVKNSRRPSIFDLKTGESENEVDKELKLIRVNSVKQKVEMLNRTFAENSKPVKYNFKSSQSADTWKCVACAFVNSSGKFNCSACNLKKNSPLVKTPPVKKLTDIPEMTNPDAFHYKELIQLQDADLVPNAEPFTCPICIVDYSPGEGVILKDCLHTFCRTCLISTIQFSEDAEVKCPYLDETYSCTSVLQQREIKALVPRGVFELHLAKSVKEAENKIGNAFHCKTPDCKGWCIFEDNVNVFHCPVCKNTNCLTCQAIHPGINCKEYQERMKDASETDLDAKKSREMLEEMVEKGEAMACPKCQVVLMKKWGCDWLRCSMCKTEICWVTRGFRWGPGGKGDTTGGCKCGVNGVKCHPKCNYCH